MSNEHERKLTPAEKDMVALGLVLARDYLKTKDKKTDMDLVMCIAHICVALDINEQHGKWCAQVPVGVVNPPWSLVKPVIERGPHDYSELGISAWTESASPDGVREQLHTDSDGGLEDDPRVCRTERTGAYDDGPKATKVDDFVRDEDQRRLNVGSSGSERPGDQLDRQGPCGDSAESIQSSCACDTEASGS